MADLNAFKKGLKKDLETGRVAFEGIYATQLEELMGLSRDEIDAITPDETDLKEYDRLISVVKQASAHNLSQAQLKANIQELGSVAMSIAQKVAGLASIVV